MNIKLFRAKIGNLLFSLVFFYTCFVGLHEFGHYLAAQWAGVPGGQIIPQSFFRAAYYWPDGFTPSAFQNLAVSLGGGFSVAFIFGIGLIIRSWSLKYSPWDLDDTFAMFTAGTTEFLYAFSEIINWQIYGGQIATLVGFGFGILIYGKRIIKWLTDENA